MERDLEINRKIQPTSKMGAVFFRQNYKQLFTTSQIYVIIFPV